jgi:hypothetical protein
MLTVGMFADLEPARPQAFHGSIQDAVRAEAGPDERNLIEYLKGGISLIDIMEATKDVISGDEYVTGGSSLLTDGTWVWREDLRYYVDRYHLELDPAFVQHAAESGFRIPPVERDQVIAIARKSARDIYNMS